MTRTLRIATRGSALARAQTGLVGDAIARATGADVELVIIKTEGDTSRESLASLGGTGVFASALREALVRGDVDLIVHSLKDLPTARYPGLVIGAVPAREDARDVLCAVDGRSLAELPQGARVGTGSPRRRAQLLSLRPDLNVIDIRGNIDTRLRSIEQGDLHGVVLAAAGLERLGRLSEASEYFDLELWPTAPGQGALAIEAREGDDITDLLSIEHRGTHVAVHAERGVLAALEAGCAAPIGAHATIDDGVLTLTAVVYQSDGAAELGCTRSVDLPGSDFPGSDLHRGQLHGGNLPGAQFLGGDLPGSDDVLSIAHSLGAAVAAQLLDDGAAQLVPRGAIK